MSTKQEPTDSLGVQQPPKTQPPKLLFPPMAQPSKPSCSPKTESPIAVKERFRSNDLKLLKTGQYSDAQVTVGDRIWKVHKSIVCQRSEYLAGVSFRTAKDGEPIPEELPFKTTEKLAKLLLEFIYSGGIKSIDSFSMADCVELSILGENFRVYGMVSYATNNLWERLTPTLECFYTMPGAAAATEPFHGCKLAVADMEFELDFRTAVSKAYGHPDNACQLLLADFVWAARDQLLGTPAIVALHKAHPLFGTHVFATLNLGPQSPFTKLDRQLRHCGLCRRCARHSGKRPKRALQVFEQQMEPFGGGFSPEQNTHKEAV